MWVLTGKRALRDGDLAQADVQGGMQLCWVDETWTDRAVQSVLSMQSLSMIAPKRQLNGTVPL